MTTFLVVAAVVAATPGAIAALHLSILTLAAMFFRRTVPTSGKHWRLLYLVSARNEEALIARAVNALARQKRADDIILVVADRCSDRTAMKAASAGAEVLERPPDAAHGKSGAIRDGIRHVDGRQWDALVTVDADSVVNDGFAQACERILGTGAPVAQARSESLPGSGLIRQASVVASALQGVALPRGRDRLGVSVRLKGPGMIVRRDVLDSHAFPLASSSEDTRYGIELVLAGIVARHVDDARVLSESTRRLRVLTGQRVRWETGRVQLARAYVPSLLCAHTAASWEAAVHLLTPPVAVAVLLLGAGGVLAAGVGAWPIAVAMASLVGLIALDVVVALFMARASARAWVALALAPAYVVWKGLVQARALLRTRTTDRPFEPTTRE